MEPGEVLSADNGHNIEQVGLSHFLHSKGILFAADNRTYNSPLLKKGLKGHAKILILRLVQQRDTAGWG